MLSIILGVLAVLYFLRRWSYQNDLKKFTTQSGAGPVKKIYRLPLGLDAAPSTISDFKNHRFMKVTLSRFEQNGDTLESNFLGRKTIITRDPQNIKAILATQFAEFNISDRTQMMAELFGHHGIFTQSPGAGWEQSRALLRPQFSRSQIVNDLDGLDHHTKILLSLFPVNTKFDIQPFLYNLTLDTATEFLFGESAGSLESPEAGENFRGSFSEAFKTAQHYISFKSRLRPLHFMVGLWDHTRACNISRAYVAKYVDKCLKVDAKTKNAGDKYVFLEALAEQTTDRKVLTDQLLNILLAGRDTTAGLISHTMWLLARNKQVWHKLREEVLSHVGPQRRPDWETMKEMKYLKYVLNESLRLLPVVPNNGRVCLKRTTIPTGGGLDGKLPIVVQKGQTVLYSIYSTHRRKVTYGEDVEVFRPERWENLRPPAWDYLPFNGGPRICLGQQYALTEASFVMIRILQEYKDIFGYDGTTGKEVLGNGEEKVADTFNENLSVTLSSNNGVHVRLVPAGE